MKALFKILLLVAGLAATQSLSAQTDLELVEVGLMQPPRYGHDSYVYVVLSNHGADTVCDYHLQVVTSLSSSPITCHVEACLLPSADTVIILSSPLRLLDDSQLIVTLAAEVTAEGDINDDNNRITADMVVCPADDDFALDRFISPTDTPNISDTLSVSISICNRGHYPLTDADLVVDYNGQYVDTFHVFFGREGLLPGLCAEYTLPRFYHVSMGYTTIEVVSLSPYDHNPLNDTLFTLFYAESATLAIDQGTADAVDPSVYPNPATDNVMLQFFSPVAQTARLSVFDSRGNSVYAKSLSLTAGANEEVLRMGYLPSGLYIVYVEMPGGNYRLPVVVR